MNVGELKAFLQDCPDDMKLVVSGSNHSYRPTFPYAAMAVRNRFNRYYENDAVVRSLGDTQEAVLVFG